ncbi:hypothetical protein C8Q73DRAFT_494669 [Cubamyces lactineus]|nr:hypothetical protein C8Q73DRAFT_494669 [Cubamyces lactineus]
MRSLFACTADSARHSPSLRHTSAARAIFALSSTLRRVLCFDRTRREGLRAAGPPILSRSSSIQHVRTLQISRLLASARCPPRAVRTFSLKASPSQPALHWTGGDESSNSHSITAPIRGSSARVCRDCSSVLEMAAMA